MIDLKNHIAGKLQSFFSNRQRTTTFMVVVAMLVSVFAYCMQKSIVVEIDGKPTKISTFKTTVKDALLSAGIGASKGDKVVPSLDSKVTNDMKIKIKRAVPINVRVDGKGLVIYTAENTVGDMFKTEGITLHKSDIVSPSIQSSVQRDMKISVTRVAENTVTVAKKVAYKVLSKTDPNYEKGKIRVIKPGVDGVKEAKYRVIYKDGKEVSRFLIGETIKKAPIDKIVAVGSLAWFTPTKGARKIYYTNKLKVKATSYTADYKCTGKRPGDRGFGITATGTKARRDADGFSTVAVDKHVIPLGTKLYVEGYGYAIAEDVGGGVKGKHIDLYFSPGSREYRNWFTHHVNVYVLR